MACLLHPLFALEIFSFCLFSRKSDVVTMVTCCFLVDWFTGRWGARLSFYGSLEEVREVFENPVRRDISDFVEEVF
jgi:hypothetical protein